MDAQKLLDSINTEDVIRICCHLQKSDDINMSGENILFSTVLDHPETSGGSMKLCYFPESKLFYCYTRPEEKPYNLINLVMKATKLSFKDSIEYIANFFDYKEDCFFEDNIKVPTELEIFEQYDITDIKRDARKQSYDPTVLKLFDKTHVPEKWTEDGIDPIVMYRFGIRVDAAYNRIIIPQVDENGDLVGIRCRNLDPFVAETFGKYLPIKINDTIYSCPNGEILYGLYNLQHNIRKKKTVLLVEGEKSVLQMCSFYGVENSYALAVFGFNVTETQIDLLLKNGVNTVYLGFDSDFKTGRGDSETEDFLNRIKKIGYRLLPYFDVYILFDYDHLLPYKSSPTDGGKELYEELLKNKIHLTGEE